MHRFLYSSLPVLVAAPLCSAAAKPVVFDLVTGMRFDVSYTYLSRRDAPEASVTVESFGAVGKNLISVQIRSNLPILELGPAVRPANPYLPGPARAMRVLRMDVRGLRAEDPALADGIENRFPGLWPHDDPGTLLWISRRTYMDLIARKPTPWKAEAGRGGQSRLVDTTLRQDSVDGFYNLQYDGRDVTVTAIRAHDELQNYYLILPNPANPLILSARYGLMSAERSDFAGGGYDITAVTLPAAPSRGAAAPQTRD